MPDKLILTITVGPHAGKAFPFEEHDTLLFGRASDCQICLPADQQISRHHFLLEVNPPDARLRDLGSRNGTFINGQKCGGRARHETPEEGARREYPQVDLHHGDEIKVGQTSLQVEAMPEPVPEETVRRGSETPEDLPRDQQVAVLTDYEMGDLLGAGGMGAVYLARHKQSGEQVAVKVMRSKVRVDEQARQRFLREIEATRTLQHSHLVRFLGNGSEGDTFYFLLEYCEGGSVADLVKRRGGRLSLEEARPILLQALEGLAYVHAQGFVHRDLKPQNILLNGRSAEQWCAKIADLGLAKSFEQAGFSGMTATGSFAGSFPFMPREQVINFKRVQPMSDVWAMGATCYALLTGAYPRELRPGQDPLLAILQEECVPIRQRASHIPAGIAEVIDRSLATKEGERYQNGREMYEALLRAWEEVSEQRLHPS